MNLPLYLMTAVREAESQFRWAADATEKVQDAIVQYMKENGSARVGKTISAATSSKIQVALDAMADANDSYMNAKKALQVLIAFAGAAEEDVPEKGSSGMTKKNIDKHQSIGSGRARDHQSRPGQGLGEAYIPPRRSESDYHRSRPGQLPVPPWQQ
jgi:hypothetical protein